MPSTRCSTTAAKEKGPDFGAMRVFAVHILVYLRSDLICKFSRNRSCLLVYAGPRQQLTACGDCSVRPASWLASSIGVEALRDRFLFLKKGLKGQGLRDGREIGSSLMEV